MFDLTITGLTGKIALLVALPTTLILLYLLLRRTEVRRHLQRRWKKTTRFLNRKLITGQNLTADDEDDDSTNQTSKSSRQTVIEVKVPAHAASSVIGRQGSTIKNIQKCSSTQIHFKDDANTSNEDRLVCIRGNSQAVQQAELMIRRIIADIPTITSEEMYIPNSTTGLIIGKGGESVRVISRITGAKILIEKEDSRDPQYMRSITLEGSREQIEHAKKIINEKIDENLTFQAENKLKKSKKASVPLEEYKPSRRKVMSAKEKWDTQEDDPDLPSADERKNLLEILVVSAESPGHFWVHIRNENLPKLIELQRDIDAFYGDLDQSEIYNISEEAAVNDVVAVCLHDGSRWYRARITSVLEDQFKVFCVDYGYNEEVPKENVRRLRGDFLSLPFQAVECYLANVKPKDDDDWSDYACNAFENMVCIDQSKVMSGEIVRYQRTSRGLVPCLQLVDFNGPQDVIVNEELVEMGHAQWDKSSDLDMVENEGSAMLSQEVPSHSQPACTSECMA